MSEPVGVSLGLILYFCTSKASMLRGLVGHAGATDGCIHVASSRQVLGAGTDGCISVAWIRHVRCMNHDKTFYRINTPHAFILN